MNDLAVLWINTIVTQNKLLNMRHTCYIQQIVATILQMVWFLQNVAPSKKPLPKYYPLLNSHASSWNILHFQSEIDLPRLLFPASYVRLPGSTLASCFTSSRKGSWRTWALKEAIGILWPNGLSLKNWLIWKPTPSRMKHYNTCMASHLYHCSYSNWKFSLVFRHRNRVLQRSES